MTIEPWMKPRSGLGRARQQLQSEDCRVAYLGASVTAQKDGYRPQLHAWLVQNFAADHRAINAGFGGVGSISGVFTMDEQVVRFRPQLCFIEFSSGDMAGKTPLAEIGPVIEGMVRKLAAIDCQVCFLYLYRSDQMFLGSNTVLREYEKVAEHYGIPSINIGQWIEGMIAAGDMKREALVRDVVHTTAQGSHLTVEGIAQALAVFFRGPDGTATTQALKPRIYARTYEQTEIINVDATLLKDPDNYVANRFRFTYPVVQIDETNELQFQLHGELIGILVVVGPDSGFIEVKSADTLNEYLLWDEWCHYSRIQTVILEQPIAADQAIQIRLSEKPVDFSGSRRLLENSDTLKKCLKIVGLLVRGESNLSCSTETYL